MPKSVEAVVSRLAPILLSFLCLTVIGAAWMLWRGQSERLSEAESALRESWDEVERLRIDLAARDKQLEDSKNAALQRYRELEAHKRELGQRILEFEDQNGLLGQELEKARAQIEELSARADAVERRRRAPMPIGIRRVLRDLDGLLDDAGRSDLRFLRVEKIEDRVLHDVELLHRSPDGFGTTVFTASRCELVLERSVPSAEFRLYDGSAVGDEAGKFSAEKPRIVAIGEVDGRRWESVLPTVLRANGEYTVEEQPELVPVTPLAQSDWRARFDRVFSLASGVETWKLARYRSEDSTGFRGVLLHGYEGETELLARTIDCQRAAFEIDREQGLVSLYLQDGWIRRKRGDTRIGVTGLRLPLPGVTPEMVHDEMLGHVRYR